MLTRAITSVFFVLTLLTAFYFGYLSTFFLFFVITTIGVEEFYSIVSKNKDYSPLKFFGLLTAIISFVILTMVIQNTISTKYLAVPFVFIFTMNKF